MSIKNRELANDRNMSTYNGSEFTVYLLCKFIVCLLCKNLPATSQVVLYGVIVRVKIDVV